MVIANHNVAQNSQLAVIIAFRNAIVRLRRIVAHAHSHVRTHVLTHVAQRDAQSHVLLVLSPVGLAASIPASVACHALLLARCYLVRSAVRRSLHVLISVPQHAAKPAPTRKFAKHVETRTSKSKLSNGSRYRTTVRWTSTKTLCLF
jgi:hypothetical protein